MAALSDDVGSFAGQVEVLDVEGEDLVGSGRGFIQHPPQCLFSQPDTGSGPEGVEVVVGYCFGLVAGYPFAVDGRQRVRRAKPLVTAAVTDEGLESGEASVPGGRRCVTLTFGQHRMYLEPGEVVHRKSWAEVRHQSVEGLAVRAATVRGQVFVAKESLHSISKGGDPLR